MDFLRVSVFPGINRSICLATSSSVVSILCMNQELHCYQRSQFDVAVALARMLNVVPKYKHSSETKMTFQNGNAVSQNQNALHKFKCFL